MSHKAHMLLHTEHKKKYVEKMHKKDRQSVCIIVGGFCTDIIKKMMDKRRGV